MKEIVSQPTNGVICEDGKIAKNGLRVICPFCGEIGLSQGRGGSVNVWTVGAIERRECTKCRKQFHTIALTAKMFQEYDRAAKAIRRDIGDFYSKYAGKYGLTYDQAVRLLTRKEFQEWKATLGEYIARIAAEPDPRVKALLTAQLDALSTNSRISRLEALLGQIDLKLNELWETGVSQMKAEFGETFREGYYKKVYDIQSRAGFIHEFAKLDESVVENVLSYPWSGAMFSDRLWRNKQALLFHVRETITQGVMQGKSVATMSKELSAKMGQSYVLNADNEIRTAFKRDQFKGAVKDVMEVIENGK